VSIEIQNPVQQEPEKAMCAQYALFCSWPFWYVTKNYCDNKLLFRSSAYGRNSLVSPELNRHIPYRIYDCHTNVHMHVNYKKRLWMKNRVSHMKITQQWKSILSLRSGAPNVNFRKISVRKTIWDLEFLEH